MSDAHAESDISGCEVRHMEAIVRSCHQISESTLSGQELRDEQLGEGDAQRTLKTEWKTVAQFLHNLTRVTLKELLLVNNGRGSDVTLNGLLTVLEEGNFAASERRREVIDIVFATGLEVVYSEARALQVYAVLPNGIDVREKILRCLARFARVLEDNPDGIRSLLEGCFMVLSQLDGSMNDLIHVMEATMQLLEHGICQMEGLNVHTIVKELEKIVKGILQCQVPSGCLVEFIGCCVDLHVSEALALSAFENAVQQAVDVDLVELPGLVHQLCRFSVKPLLILKVCRALFWRASEWWMKLEEYHTYVVQGIVSMMDEIDCANAIGSTLLTEVYSSVLLHLEMFGKRDAHIVKVWIGYMQSCLWRPTVFSVSLTFAFCSVPKYREEIWKVLDVKLRESRIDGMDEYMKYGVHVPAPLMYGSQQLVHSMLESITRYKYSSEQLLDFCIHYVRAAKNNGGMEDQLSQRLEEIFCRMFEEHPPCRNHLLSSCFLECAHADGTSHFSRIILTIVSKHAKLLLKSHFFPFRQCVSVLSSAEKPSNAVALVRACWPIFSKESGLEDTLVITLRKNLFSKRLLERMISIQCLIEYSILKLEAAQQAAYDLESPNGCSQAHVVVSQIQLSSGAGASMIHELLGVMRRCLCQQPELRQCVYQGIERISRVAPRLKQPFISLIVSRIKQVMKKSDHGDVMGLRSLMQCGEGEATSMPKEPVGFLFKTACCLVDSSQSSSELRSLLSKMLSCILRENMDEILRGAKLSAEQKRSLESMYSQLTEDCLFWAVRRIGFEYATGIEDEMSVICDKYGKYTHKQEDGVSEGAYVISEPPLNVVQNFLRCALEESFESGGTKFSALAKDERFIKFVMEVTLRWMKCKLSKPEMLQSTGNLSKITEYLFRVASLTILSNATDISTKKGKKISLNVASQCINYILIHHNALFFELSDAIFEKIERLFQKLVQGGHMKAIQVFSSSIAIVMPLLVDKKSIEIVGTMLDAGWNTAPDIVREDSQTIVSIHTLILKQSLLRIGENCDLECLNHLQKEIHAYIQSMQHSGNPEEEPVEDGITFSEQSVCQLLKHASSYIDQTCSCMTVWLGRLKDCTPLFVEMTQDENTSGTLCDFEIQLLRRLLQLSQCAVSLAALVTRGKVSESYIKCLTKLYKTLKAAALLRTTSKRKATSNVLHTFQRLVMGINTQVTPLVYKIVGEVQQTLEEHDSALKENKEVPNLIFQVEEWERYVIKLSKAEHVNLMVSAKRSINRDFRVKMDGKRLRSTEEPS